MKFTLFSSKSCLFHFTSMIGRPDAELGICAEESQLLPLLKVLIENVRGDGRGSVFAPHGSQFANENSMSDHPNRENAESGCPENAGHLRHKRCVFGCRAPKYWKWEGFVARRDQLVSWPKASLDHDWNRNVCGCLFG